MIGQQTIYDQLNPGPTHGSLFSGYGGIDLALEEVFSARTVWVSDIDPGACAVLDRRFPEAENLGDITQIPWEDVPRVDILSGGSPCQDLSAAGRRAGMTEGTRSNLWVQMREAIATLRPRLVVWENVAGALSARATSELEREKHARDRACICGGADRRGGEHPYRGDEGEVVRPESVLGDDPSSRGNDVGAAQGIRRDSPGDEAGDGEMGRGVDVVCPRPGRKTVPFGNSSVPADKEGSRDRGTPSRRSPGCAAEASERAGQVDGGCAGAVPGNERGGPDSEHEGSSTGECAECGGRIDGSPANSELESVEGRVGDGAGGPSLRALGRVLGDLAEIGFDAEWATVRASDVGAPHGRARVFLLAWPSGYASPSDSLRAGGWWRASEPIGGATERADAPADGADRLTGASGDARGVTLLPTPMTSYSARSAEQWIEQRRAGNGQRRSVVGDLGIVAEQLLPTPRAGEPERSTHLATRLHYTIGEGRASTSETGSREDVRDVRGGDDSEAVRETAGGPNSIPGEEDLLSGLWQHACGSDEECSSLESQEGDTDGRVRGMRDHTGAARASQGPQPGEQHHGEPDGPVRFVPSTAALGGGSREESGRDQECGGSPWGAYAPAIRRWEAVTGRLAPDPTIPSPRTGKPQLSPLLVEWMMGLPNGWFTDPELGLSRVQQLQLGGNGVVPQQAAYTIGALLERSSMKEAS